MTVPTHRVPPRLCPGCGQVLDAATGIDHKNAPKPGDITVCIYCTAPLQFLADGTVRFMSEEELAAEPAEIRRQVAHVRSTLRLFRPRRRPRGRPN